MRKFQLRTFFVFAALLVAASVPLVAQSLTSGAIAGTITDPTSAVIPNVSVTLKSLDTGAAQNTTTNGAGEYRFTLLRPGRYSVTAAAPGFQKMERQVSAAVGQIATANMALEVGQAAETVEVTAASSLINPDPSMNTAFTPEQLQNLPNAGGDITNIAFTAPGVVVNSTGGYGNFTVNGLPATSNLFTVNGENNMDPYFNISNSGATNLTLGQNEIQEATVIANPYAGQYGQLAGAQVTYVTRGGTNEFHGNAQYWWNGRYLNANNWFNNFYGDSRPFSNSNQWATGVGGPVRKDKTFFFVDYEGLKFVLPNVQPVTIPTPAFANAVLSNIQRTQPAEYSTYQKLFGQWLGAPGASNATPIANSSYCNSLSLTGFDPKTQRCAAKFQAAPTGLASEWILSGRVDQRFGDKDSAFFRYKTDRGVQPTQLDPINSAFSAISQQPSWDTQANEIHVFGPRATNSFMATLSHYVALFQQQHDLAYSTFPYDVISSGAVPFTEVNWLHRYPQGRNITQYQFIDDFSYIAGRHALKFGANFRRYDVSDHSFYYNYPTVYFGYTGNGLQNFADGIAYQYRQALNASSDVPIAMWGLGMYAQDEWRVANNLKLTLALRAERNSNPVCQQNCFSNFKGPWETLPSVTSANPGSVPYSNDVIYGQHQAYPGVDAVNWSPRIGFSWSPGGNTKTLVSGGIGIFYDSPPAGLVDNLLANPPSSVTFRVQPTVGVLPFDPAGGAATWSASAQAFSMQKTFTQLANELSPLGVKFSAPAFTAISGTLHSPQWQQWNIQLQRELTGNLVLAVNYVGNHGIRIPYTNNWPNAYDQYGVFGGVAGIGDAPRVANYGTVGVIQSGAVSNYQGLTVTVSKRFSSWVSAHANYTWAHNLDEASNGGVFTYGDSLLGQINPLSLRAGNYGNSDYDIRHNFTADWVVTPTFHTGSRLAGALANGWQWSGKWFWRTGLPFSITDSNWGLGNSTGSILAYPTGGAGQSSCGRSAAVTPCLNASAFLDSAADSFNGYPGWSAQTRNQFRGPHFFDIDMTLLKNFKLREKSNLAIGAQAFNVLNHPNFGNPDSALGSPTFGLISTMSGSPTSPYGNFLGFDSSPRVLQLTAKITF
jgi:hypothetical protein